MQRNALCTPLLLAVTLCAGTALALAGNSWKTVAAQDGAQQEHEESPLGQAMEHMNAAMRKANRALKAGDRDAALTAVADFQANLLQAKLQTPPSAAKVPEAERAEFLNAFRGMLVKVLAVTCTLETAVIENRLDDASKILSDDLHPMEDAGHERFGGEEH